MLAREFRSPISLGWRNKWRMWRRGFVSESFVIYGLKENNPDDFVSDFARYIRARHINAKRTMMLTNKLIFQAMMHRFDAYLPRVYGVIDAGKIRAADRPNPIEDNAWIITQLKREKKLVVKPIEGWGGTGILFLLWENRMCRINGEVIGCAELLSKISKLDDYIVTEFITQAAYTSSIFPKTTNTIRALTMFDPITDKPFIARAIQRFGVERSVPTDHWSKGGLSAKVDLETGELGPAVSYPSNGALTWHKRHPDTGSQILGVCIPSWSKVRDKILAMAEALSYLPYIAWDLVVGRSGFKVLEGNDMAGLHSLQVHGPLLVDPRVRRFFREHGVL